jgi:hypothetical protein
MGQIFHDLCQEHIVAGRGLFGLVLWIFFETSVGIVKESKAHLSQLGRTLLRARGGGRWGAPPFLARSLAGLK